MRTTARRTVLGLVAVVALAASLRATGPAAASAVSGGAAVPPPTATPIKHVVVIMEENHSFDNYFGTFPGASGIPSGVCLPDPATGGCDPPYHNPGGLTHDLPHLYGSALGDVNGGAMDGFVSKEQAACQCPLHEAMSWFDAGDIPIFWRYAQNYTLQDNLFESSNSWSYPSHLMMVSGWVAQCSSQVDPLSCASSVGAGPANGNVNNWPGHTYPWTDLTWLLHRYGVAWRYYVARGTEPDCGASTCADDTVQEGRGTPSIWNPLPWFTDVRTDGQLGNIKELDSFVSDVSTGNLPAVSWIVPNAPESGHPGESTNADSEIWVQSLINAIESSSAWSSTAILVSWDDWGGLYDHVNPPTVDSLGYGLRVPGILISPYAKRGYVDHQLLSFDAYNKFIEDNFLGGQRLDPWTDGRPDARPSVREAYPQLGDLMNSFDFRHPPAPPVVLPTLTLPSTIIAGRSATAAGANFEPKDTVSITVNCGSPDCAGGIPVVTVRVRPDGTFSATFTVPFNAPLGPEFVSAAGTSPLTYFGIASVSVG